MTARTQCVSIEFRAPFIKYNKRAMFPKIAFRKISTFVHCTDDKYILCEIQWCFRRAKKSRSTQMIAFKITTLRQRPNSVVSRIRQKMHFYFNNNWCALTGLLRHVLKIGYYSFFQSILRGKYTPLWLGFVLGSYVLYA